MRKHIIRFVFICGLVCSLFVGIVPAVAADTHTVSTTAELEAAFAAAASGDTILIAAGTYYPWTSLISATARSPSSVRVLATPLSMVRISWTRERTFFSVETIILTFLSTLLPFLAYRPILWR